MPNPRTGCLTQLQRGSRLVLKLLKGLLLIGCVFPQLRPSERDVIIESWCREVLDVLSVRVNLRGETPPGKVSSVLFVANHVSWIDILVMNACRRVRFVAKSAVPTLGTTGLSDRGALGVAREERETQLVSLVYPIYLVCLVEPDRPNRPDQPSLVTPFPPISPVSLELDIGT
jgi:hypothetical protein